MPDDLLIARNDEDGSTLPYLIRVPLGIDGVVLKVRDTWPRTSKIYCHRVDRWPVDAEIVERLPVRSVTRRGAAIDLVLERARENRSQFVLTRARNREMIFWQSPRTTKQARPAVSVPTARAHGQVLEIVVDTAEKYAYSFNHQQTTTTRRRLVAGDYAVFDDDTMVATVERKSVADLGGSLTSGRMTYAMADLTAVHRAAVVVESGYSKIFGLDFVSGATMAEAVAETQARFPSVPIMFCDNRKMAQEWTYRWLGACLAEWRLGRGSADALVERAPATAASAADIRRWALAAGLPVPAKGRIPALVRAAWDRRDLDR